MSIRKVSLDQVERVAYQIAKKFMEWDEPIPDFSQRDQGKLESSLSEPFMTFDGKDLHKGFYRKGAILFYLMNKNHPFINGNKRMAIATLVLFLYINNKWIRVSNERFYYLALDVVNSDPKIKDDMVNMVEAFLKEVVVDLD